MVCTTFDFRVDFAGNEDIRKKKGLLKEYKYWEVIQSAITHFEYLYQGKLDWGYVLNFQNINLN